jgi:hypothetical protein
MSQAAVVMQSARQWEWVAVPAGPLWANGRQQLHQVTTAISFNRRSAWAAKQTPAGQTALIPASERHRTPVVMARSFPGSTGVCPMRLEYGANGHHAHPSGPRLWAVGGVVAAPPISAAGYGSPEHLAPLIHPVLAAVVPSGRLVHRVVLQGLTVAPAASRAFRDLPY